MKGSIFFIVKLYEGWRWIIIYWFKWPPFPKWGYMIRLQGGIKIELNVRHLWLSYSIMLSHSNSTNHNMIFKCHIVCFPALWSSVKIHLYEFILLNVIAKGWFSAIDRVCWKIVIFQINIQLQSVFYCLLQGLLCFLFKTYALNLFWL